MMTVDEKREWLMNAWGVPEYVIDEQVEENTADGVLDEEDVLEDILFDVSGGFEKEFPEEY